MIIIDYFSPFFNFTIHLIISTYSSFFDSKLLQFSQNQHGND